MQNKRAELTAFLCFLKKVTGPIKVHVDNKGIRDGLWRGNPSIRKLVMLTCGSKTWEELHLFVSQEIVVEVERVKAHRTKKDKKERSQFEVFLTDGNEKSG